MCYERVHFDRVTRRYVLAPQTGRYLEEKAARLCLGAPPERMANIGPFTWTTAVDVELGPAHGAWAFQATSRVNGLTPKSITAMIEPPGDTRLTAFRARTGTSYLLVPARECLEPQL